MSDVEVLLQALVDAWEFDLFHVKDGEEYHDELKAAWEAAQTALGRAHD